MEELFPRIKKIGHPTGYWWMPLLLGIIFLAMGVIVLSFPRQSYTILSIAIGIVITMSGLIQIFTNAFAFSGSGKGWQVAIGIIEMALGVILMFHISVSAVIVPLLIGFWLLFRGVTMIGFAHDMRRAGITGNGWSIFWGAVIMASGFLIVIYPSLGVGSIILIIGLSFIILGVAMIFLSVYLGVQKKRIGN